MNGHKIWMLCMYLYALHANVQYITLKTNQSINQEELSLNQSEMDKQTNKKSHWINACISLSSLSHILDEMSLENASEDNDNSKLFRIKLELWDNQLKFVPTLAVENDKDSFVHTIRSLIKDICSVSHQIDRIAQPISECSSTKRTYQSKR